MRIDPALRAPPERFDAFQHAGADAVRAWRECAGSARVLADLARYGEGQALAECRALVATLADPRAFALAALRVGIAVLRAAPLCQLPWRHFSNGVLHSVVLASAERASLSLAVLDGAAWRAARDPQAGEPATFQPGEFNAAVLAGGARGRILRNESSDPARAAIVAEAVALSTGDAYAIDGMHEALMLDAIDDRLVTLRLYRSACGETPARQYDAATGALVRQAAGACGDSRAELAIALLRAMDRTDAAPAIAARTTTGSPEARWQALRECLALDSGTGFAALLEIAETPGDPLAEPARALVDRLALGHPSLAALRRTVLCPA